MIAGVESQMKNKEIRVSVEKGAISRDQIAAEISRLGHTIEST